jgi:hypothetical protein
MRRRPSRRKVRRRGSDRACGCGTFQCSQGLYRCWKHGAREIKDAEQAHPIDSEKEGTAEKAAGLRGLRPALQETQRGPRKKPQGYADSALRYRRHKGDRGKSRRATRTPPCATGDTKEPAEKAAGLRGLRPALQERQRSPRKSAAAAT